VIVTGAAMGIGKLIAVTFAQEGANILVADINQMKATETIKECESCGVKTDVIRTDVADLESVRNMVANTLSKFRQIDIMVHDAVAFFGPTWRQNQVSEEGFDFFEEE
jgi:NAD(P)-dependent dehydrogenase (short-subunit alcohol dehydrogenase family)